MADQDTDLSNWEELSAGNAAKHLKFDPQKRLSETRAQRRMERYGRNAIEEIKESLLVRLLKNFWGPIPWMLEAAIILAAIARRREDLAVIAPMLMINGGISFWHVSKAQNAIEALKQRLAPSARM